jgi:nicotinate-nucleotide adenylyltransferase
MRIGLFGGSFDPVHWGHLIAADSALEQAGLERVLFVPAREPPHKVGRLQASPSERVEMLELAIAGAAGLDVSTVEIDSAGVSFTVETLRTLRDRAPEQEMHLILGADAFADLPDWREPAAILDLATLLPLEREGVDCLPETCGPASAVGRLLGPARLERAIESRVRMPPIGIRSTALRQALADGRSIRYRTPAGVEAYIRSRGLYGSGLRGPSQRFSTWPSK